MKGIIYKLECIKNGLCYIGKTKNLESRKAAHNSSFKYNKNNKYLQKDWNKYGSKGFKYIILEECDLKNLTQKERFWIKKLNTIWPNGYNIAEGHAQNLTEEYRKKISNSIKGEKHPLFGIKPSEETKLKIGKSNSKLTEKQYFEIRNLLLEETNETIRDKNKRIASLYNVHPITIYNIRLGLHKTAKRILGGGLKEWLGDNNASKT